ncbi:hypothetical protein SM124_09525 [Bacillus sp. 31A1R]|uniref:Uncharacterized protein n=1 Tax=Robertmurraya mangrovi TaxID=3098077 RepID=A0ABU5IXY6_9BACI|nr:hypothetical protein [Bacillus sp. 31A1R]MDZ5471987.1 hypothetical protein [Bacillus sp. 31A1R]
MIKESNSNEHLILVKNQYYKNYLQKELDRYKYIKVPTKKMSLTNEEFVDWAFELLSPKELSQLISMIETAKGRSSSVRPILETIAIGIVQKQTS